ncbi:3'(2'),5'-bisphosphate nucleotidase [Desulfonema ishimotonii]|uniref:3'(2'),5'-bisphosphate nucleotidase n=1 Tax=Desulfonema ishimotonii TaxID=45657 RepID=A0A401FU73_9BACT|nr:3'(2'),5'-bisphosphate nucleotidase [Desulfonema ishimotonii]GBC60488.1 3'(2'),5'-bisphosphate nucleotidase [Desulfonema ishimotonii]
MPYEKELEIALNAVKKASALCRRAQMTLVKSEAVAKKDRSPVTIADFGSQAVVTLSLMAAFPGDFIVGEEDAGILRENAGLRQKVCALVEEQAGPVSADQMMDAIDQGACTPDFSGRFWTVDPIDGTKGFLREEQYAIALALVENGQVVLGVLGCPDFPGDEGENGGLFFAVRGGGTFMLPGNAQVRQKIAADRIKDSRDARFCESVESAHAAHDVHARIAEALGIKAQPLRMDSQAKYGAVACGLASVYLRLPRSSAYREKIWDHAAGVIIVEEAGGRVTDFSGNPLDFSTGRTLEKNVGILATNTFLHDDVLKAIRAVQSEG